MSNDPNPCMVRGQSSVLISVPHAGEFVPPELLAGFTAQARALPDTDRYVDRLYDWAPALGAGMIVAPVSRYVVDLNRPPDDAPLYDQATAGLLTGVVPKRTFAGQPVYEEDGIPDVAEEVRRIERYWNPYHGILTEELERIRQLHGHAVLLDAHSIRSREPLLFEGILPDLNLGSNGGKSAAKSLLNAATAALEDPRYSRVVDGRFKGGYITRHYGQPGRGIHALQLEMAQSAYMREDEAQWDDELARPMQGLLKRLVHALTRWSPGCD